MLDILWDCIGDAAHAVNIIFIIAAIFLAVGATLKEMIKLIEEMKCKNCQKRKQD